MLSLQDPLLCRSTQWEAGDVITHLQGPEIFGSRVTHFFRDPSQFCTDSYSFFFWGSHMQEQYHQWTPLRTLSPVVAQRHDVPRDWLWDACHMAGVPWWFHCKGFCNEEGPHYCIAQSARNITINLYSQVGNSLRIPTRAVLRSSAGLMSCKKVSVRQFLWVRKVWFTFPQWTFTQETFGKKGGNRLTSRNHACCA